MMQRKSVTLIELIIAMVILGLVVSTMMGVLSQVTVDSTFSEDISRASFYAQSLMEEISAKRFDENTASPWSNLGIDSNESSSNHQTFDDVDDYINCSDNSIVYPAAGFMRSVNVEYISLNGNNWVMNSSADHPPYKRIMVTANRVGSDNLITLIGFKGAE